MTAEEYANQHFDRAENERTWCMIANAFNAGRKQGLKEGVQIAEKAVGEDLEDNQYGDHQLSSVQESTCNRILSRIKAEIGGE